MNKRIICSGAFKPDSKKLWITWSILDACNYSCEYCPIKANKYASDDIIDKTIKFINGIQDRNIELTLFGGEPTLHKKLEYIIKSVNVNKIRIFTNLSADYELYNYLYKKYYCTYSISFHPDQISVTNFIVQLNKIDENSIGFVNVMLVNDYDEILSILEYLRAFDIHHRIAPIHELGNESKFLHSIQYNNRYKNNFYDTEIVYDNGEQKLYTEQECRFFNLMNFNTYKCYKGYSSFFITYNGEIFKCLQDMKHKSMYSIDSSYDEIFSIEQSCPYEKCICENYIPKEISSGLCNKILNGVSDD